MGGLFISASGILDALRRSDVGANNTANLLTPGFRAGRSHSLESAAGGVTSGGVSHDQARGPLQVTGRPLDVAGGGFFRVRLPDGSIAFTRDGHFGLNADGDIITSGGARLDPPIQVPANASNVSVSADGTVFATVPGELEPQSFGAIEVFQFPNPDGLESIGQNLFRQTPATGEPMGASTATGLMPGMLEGSNADLGAEQVNTLLNRRAFEANLSAFRAQSEVPGELLNLQE